LKIQFLGAAQTVTGSRYLITQGENRILIDCGLFQGYKSLRLQNWDPFPVDPKSISAVLLTHAHLDHSGYLPRLQSEGFSGNIYSTSSTRDLCEILLPDSGFLQEEEARYANKHRYSKHAPALPLYTKDQAVESLRSFVPVPWKTWMALGEGSDTLRFRFHPAGHILGAASIEVRSLQRGILFSGDLGRHSDPIHQNPDCSLSVDAIVVESTYGDRLHNSADPQTELAEIVERTISRGGTVLIPSFAVGRAQFILHYLHELKIAGRLPAVPIYLNSPMAIKASSVFCKNATDSKISTEEAKAICDMAIAVSSVEDSKRLDADKSPKIIIAASGMATGGRVLHHLKTLLPNERNTIVFAGYQAGGTRGDAIVHGAEEVKIHGVYWPINAEIAQLDSVSAHADRDEVISWIRQQTSMPHQIFVTHGESRASDELRRRLAEIPYPNAVVPNQNSSFVISKDNT
jgi:metallo-beta-lactamase family protein